MDPQPGPIGKFVLVAAYLAIMAAFSAAVHAYGGPWLEAHPWPTWANILFLSVLAIGFVWVVWNHNVRRITD